MSDDVKHFCVLIPCSEQETWAVPQNCLAEIITLPIESEMPPEQVEWRGRTIPVVHLGERAGAGWGDHGCDTGLIAVFLGLEGDGCRYWGLAVHGELLKMAQIQPEDIEDAPECVSANASAAFHYQGQLCQVPDLDSVQKRILADARVA